MTLPSGCLLSCVASHMVMDPLDPSELALPLMKANALQFRVEFSQPSTCPSNSRAHISLKRCLVNRLTRDATSNRPQVTPKTQVTFRRNPGTQSQLIPSFKKSLLYSASPHNILKVHSHDRRRVRATGRAGIRTLSRPHNHFADLLSYCSQLWCSACQSTSHAANFAELFLSAPA